MYLKYSSLMTGRIAHAEIEHTDLTKLLNLR